MKKLPLGISTFSKMILDNHVYVDKTAIAHQLINSGTYFFLSRPRRFGKSLFLDTLREIFQGNKALFKGLYIEDKWDFDKKYPVLHISFGAGVNKNSEQLDQSIRWILRRVQDDLQITCNTATNNKECLEELIKLAQKKYGQKAVILIDEYDKPVLDNIADANMAKDMRDVLKDFYSVIKDNDKYIQFVFITGVSKFSKMNLFSGLNNLNDITLDTKYAQICGYTQSDLQNSFGKFLENADMHKLKQWYNGYNYLGPALYNPYDVLLFIDKGFEFKNYWWTTGTPSFLVDLIYAKDYSVANIENYEATDEMLDSFDLGNIQLEVLLWQTGYLTIKKKYEERGRIKYRLGIPNLEIQFSLNDFFIDTLTSRQSEKLLYQDNLYKAFITADMDGLKESLLSLFASTPYDYFKKNNIAEYEGYYASVVYAYLASLGFEIIPEDITGKGRIDLTIKTPAHIYILEFKTRLAGTGTALQQIKEKGYAEKYKTQNNIFLIGIEFDKKERNIARFDWEKKQ